MLLQHCYQIYRQFENHQLSQQCVSEQKKNIIFSGPQSNSESNGAFSCYFSLFFFNLEQVPHVYLSGPWHIKDFYYLFSGIERGREGERKGEKHRHVREILIGCLMHESRQGSESATQPSALIGIEPGILPFVGYTQPMEPHLSRPWSWHFKSVQTIHFAECASVLVCFLFPHD